MNRNDLIAALQEECRVDQTRIEDVLCALSDLCADALEKGQPFHIGDIGFLAIDPRVSHKGKGLRAAVTFQASNALRKRLNIPESELRRRHPGVCKECGRRPSKVRIYDECAECLQEKNRMDKRNHIQTGADAIRISGATDRRTSRLHARRERNRRATQKIKEWLSSRN